MRWWGVLLALSILLAACGRAAPTPTAAPAVGPSATPRAGPGVTATAKTAIGGEATPVPTVIPTPLPPALSGPLPRVVASITLGEAPQACVGNALAVDPGTGYLYVAGPRDGQPSGTGQGNACLAAINPATGQVLQVRDIPFEPHFLRWDGSTLYTVGKDYDTLVIADAGTGEIVAREPVGEEFFNERVIVRHGWVYVGLPGDWTLGTSGSLYLIPLHEGTPLAIADAGTFDVADDGRIAVTGGQATTVVRVYAGTSGLLLTEREIGPGQPGTGMVFDGQANRIFVTRQQAGGAGSPGRHFLDVLDASSLLPVGQIEAWIGTLAADPGRGRVYAYASEGHILGLNAASGQPLGTLFSIPQGEPEGFTMVYEGNVHVDPSSGRVTIVYEDFDGGSWAAGFDPATGTGVADVRVPSSAVWAEDHARGRLYFAGHNSILALDAITLEPVWRMALSREPVSAAVAPGAGYLFVGDAGGDVHVLDLGTHAEVQLLVGAGGYVDVDPAHGWLYAGDEFAAGVSTYDLATLERRGVIGQPGRPTASPADGRVYILEEDVYSADGTSLAVIEGRTVRHTGCNGCIQPTSVLVDAQRGLTHVTTYGTWVGKPGPTSHAAIDALSGRAFVARTTGGYLVRYTLAAYADLGLERPLAWRDGLYGQPLYNPISSQLYLAEGARLLVLDGETLDLIGWLYPSEEALTPAAVDTHSGRAYLLAGPRVLVLEGRGGEPDSPPPLAAAHLPGPVEGIVPLPDEGTLFVRAYDREGYTSRLYRSTNGGQSWEELRGGLPGAPNDLVCAPDGTLYAAAVPAAWRVDTAEAAWGEGVYRSGDDGDTWAPFSGGLAHLRVSRIHAGADGQLYLLATGTWPAQPDWPVPTIWRLGEDGRWNQVETAQAGPSISPDGTVPYTYTQGIGVAWHTLTGAGIVYRSWGSDLQRSTDGGLSWETLGRGPADYGTTVLSGPGEPTPIYWVTWDAVYRSVDGGASWARLVHPELVAGGPSAVAVGNWGGEETLFIGTESGELLILAGAQADWSSP